MCSARIVVKVAGMCWVMKMGCRTAPLSVPSTQNSACGPPVEEPMAIASGVSRAAGRSAMTRRGISSSVETSAGRRGPGARRAVRSATETRLAWPSTLTLARRSRLNWSALLSTREPGFVR